MNDDSFFNYGQQKTRESDTQFEYGIYDQIGDDLGDGAAGPTFVPPVNPSTSDSGSTPLFQDGAYTGPFAIKINGSFVVQSDGESIQSETFNIGVNGGFGHFPNMENSNGVFFTGDEKNVNADTQFYRVFGSITGKREIGEPVVSLYSDPSIEIAVADEAKAFGSNTRFVHEGGGVYTFFFLIATVGVSVRESGGYQIFVNQVQIGPYEYGKTNGSTQDDDGVNTTDGLRNIIICINGIPYEVDIDMTNIVKVVS